MSRICIVQYNHMFVKSFIVENFHFNIQVTNNKNDAIHFKTFKLALKFIKFVNNFIPFFGAHCELLNA